MREAAARDGKFYTVSRPVLKGFGVVAIVLRTGWRVNCSKSEEYIGLLDAPQIVLQCESKK